MSKKPGPAPGFLFLAARISLPTTAERFAQRNSAAPPRARDVLRSIRYLSRP
jgi:hypothetical protein